MKPSAALAWLFIPALFCQSGSWAVLLAPSGSRPTSVPYSVQGLGSPPLQDPLEDCFEVPGSICLEGDGDHTFIVGSLNALPDLVIWYQFDKALPVDDSGHSHHLVDSDQKLSPLVAGPGIMGLGGSAAFDGRAYRVAGDAAEALTSPASFTVAFWIYLLEDSVGSWRTVFNKAAGPDHLLPALLLLPNERRLHVHAAVPGGVKRGLDATGVLPLRRWTHVAVVSTGSVVRLYVNGLQDCEAIMEVPLEHSTGQLFIGRDPWRAGTKCYLDDFRWYSRALPQKEIKALTVPLLTGLAPDNLRLGCPACTFAEAARSCALTRGFHVCSEQELTLGGFHAARAAGWLSGAGDVWYVSDKAHDDYFTGTRKLALCCAD
jgi:hypothetical protein